MGNNNSFYREKRKEKKRIYMDKKARWQDGEKVITLYQVKAEKVGEKKKTTNGGAQYNSGVSVSGERLKRQRKSFRIMIQHFLLTARYYTLATRH